jgi:hypothetical protein
VLCWGAAGGPSSWDRFLSFGILIFSYWLVKMIAVFLLTLSITFAMGSYISAMISELLFLTTIVVFVIQVTWDWVEFLMEFVLVRQNVVL